MDRGLRRRVGRVLAVPALALALAAGASGCSGDDDGGDGDASPSAGGSAAVDEAPLATTVTVDKVAGKLADRRRAPLREDVGAVVDRWLDGAYLGDFPRSDYAGAFADFTRGARKDALKDLTLLSNDPISGRIDTATATARRVHVEVLAAKGRPVGATARVVLVFTTTGSLERSERVEGSLFLTKEKGTWKVFGYDVTKAVKR